MDFETLKHKLQNICNVILYSELQGPIEYYLHKKTKALIILILYTPDVGHYVSIFGSGRMLTYFDSFSSQYYFGKPGDLKPDLPLPEYMLKMTKQDKPLLFESISSSRDFDTLNYNEYTIQTYKNTCAAWSLLRILFREFTNKEFWNTFKDADKNGLTVALSKAIKPNFCTFL